MPQQGKYIVIEGGDGVGKSTVVHGLAAKARELLGVEVITIEEPDGAIDENGTVIVPISVELRKIIKAKEYPRDALTNVLLFNAARRENLLQAIQPALERGAWVISARNYYSTIAYQGHAQGWDITEIERMVEEATSESYMTPDHAFILDLEESERQRRVAKRAGRTDLDTFESMADEFHLKVAEGYRQIAIDKQAPLIDAMPPADEVIATVWNQLET
jgi:dTMP kinase